MTRKTSFQVLVITLLTLLLYSNSIFHDYTLDDKGVILKNQLTQQGIKGIPALFTHPQYYSAIDRQTRLYRPIPMVSHALEWEIFGKNPYVSHFINVLLYILLCILIFWLLHQWFESSYPLLPFLATLLFLAHPIHTEVVANIKGRDEILALLFCCASMLFCFRYTTKGQLYTIILSAVFYGLGIFSKESALPFLIIIPLSLYYFSGAGYKRIGLTFSLLLLVTFGYLFTRTAVFDGSGQYHFFRSYYQYPASRSDAFATATGMFIDYLRLLIIPHPLVWSYTYHQIGLISWLNWKALFSGSLLAAMVIYGLSGVRKKAVVSFCLLFFLLSYSIVSNILIPISAVFAERFMFAPSLAFVIALTYLILKIPGLLKQVSIPVMNAPAARNIIFILVFSLLTLGYGIKTFSRNFSWSDDFTLFRNDVRYLPRNLLANYFLAAEYVRKSIHTENPEKQQFLDQASLYLDRTLSIDSTFYEGYFLSGILLFQQGNYPDAIHRFTAALRSNPDFPDTTYSAEKGYGYIATAYLRQKEYDSAIRVYERIINFRPAGRAIQRNAIFPAYQNIGALYNMEQRYDQSIPYLQKALQIDPASWITWQTLGFSYLKTADYKNAVTCCLQSCRLNPTDAKSCYYLCLAYYSMGNRVEARRYLLRAISRNKLYAGESKRLGLQL